MKQIDLNADMGEGFASDLELLSVVTSANLSCGSYVARGSLDDEIARAATSAQVRIGLHPGYPDPEAFGRRSFDKLPASVITQLVKSLERAVHDAPLHARYLKPHGALYHDCLKPGYPRELVLAMLRGTKLPLMGLAGTAHESLAQEAGVGFIREGFLDRRMRGDGTLVPRSEPNAMLTDPAEIAEQALRLAETCDSLCLHGDSDHAVGTARIARSALVSAGYKVTSNTFGTVEVLQSIGPNFWIRGRRNDPALLRHGVPPGGQFEGFHDYFLRDSIYAAWLEISGPISLRFSQSAYLRLRDAGEGLRLNGLPLSDRALIVPEGGIIEIEAPRETARKQLSWSGLNSPGLHTKLVRAEDRFLCAKPFRDAPLPEYPPASRCNRLEYEPLGRSIGARRFVVHHQSSRVGIRLVPRDFDLPFIEPLKRSEPSLPGVIQQTPSGEWIVHGPDGPTISGYPKVGVMHWSAPGWLSLLRTGDEIELSPKEVMRGFPPPKPDPESMRWFLDQKDQLAELDQDRRWMWRKVRLPMPPSRGAGVE